MSHSLRVLILLAALAMSASSLFPQGFVNRVLSFNGSSSRLSTPNGTTGYNPTQITIEAWIYPTRNGGVIAEDSYTDNSSVGWILYLDDATNKPIMRGSAAQCCADNAFSAVPVPLNAWSHVAGTFDGTYLRVYVNGTQQGIVAANFSALGYNNEILSIGALNYDNVATYRYFQGQMDEIRLWSIPRSGADIQANYNKWLTGNEANLDMYFHCDEPTGDWAYNDGGYSGFGNTYNLWVPYTGTVGHPAATISGFPSVPADTSLSVWHGSVGASVRINGSNFASTPGNNSVFFGGVRAAAPTAGNSSYIDVIVPAGATYGPVTVETGGLTAYTPLPFTPTFHGMDQIAASTFELQRSLNTGILPQHVALWDFDGDGKLDVSVSSASVIQVYRNISASKDLLLEAPVTLSLPASSVTAYADLNGDGKVDIVCEPTGFSSTKPFYQNTSTPGSISFSGNASGGLLYTTSAVIDDFDGNGKPDKISASSYQGVQGLIAYYDNTSGGGTISFLGSKVREMSHPTHLASGDINGDRKPDLIATCTTCNAITILRNGGSMGGIRFDSAWTISMPAGSNPKASSLADFDNDGKLDIAVLCPGTNEVRLLRNTSTGNSATFAQTSLTGISGLTDLTVGDADGDGRVDIIVTRNNGQAMAFRNTTTGSSLTFDSPAALNTGGSQTSSALGDLNNDGAPDLIVSNADGTLSLMRNTPLGTPGNFKASYDQTSNITLTWDDNADGETGYIVYRDGVQIQTLGGDAGLAEDNSATLRQGRIYSYAVTAVNSTKGIRSDTVTTLGRLQFKGEISGKLATPRGAGVSGATVSLARTSPNRYKALTFDHYAYVSVPPSPVFDITTGTIEFWVRPDWTPAFFVPGIIIGNAVDFFNSRFLMRIGSNLDNILLYNGSYGNVTFPYTFTTDQWYHIAVALDGTNATVYVNGNSIGSQGFQVGSVTGAPLYIGNLNDFGIFRGQLDELRIWNTIRSASQIKSLMNSYTGGGETGLVGSWHFDEGTGTATADNGPTGSHYGTLLNGPAWTDISSPARRSAVTNNLGNYTLSEVDYGDTSLTGYLHASRGTDLITADTLSLQFTRNTYSFASQNFTDNSTFALSGKVVVKGYPNLGLKGVRLLVDGVPIDSTVAGGLFSVGMTADPHTIKPVFHGHKFSPDSIQVTISNDTSGIVFQDVTRDTVRGLVAAGLCQYPMGVATVRLLDTFSGSFDSLIQTDSHGNFSVRVPAVSYNVSVYDLASSDEDALNYFRSRQSAVSLLEQDPVTLATDSVTYPRGVDRKYAGIIYRTKPVLSIQGVPLAGDCPMIVVPQGKRIPIHIRVTEQYGNRAPCVTDSGEVLISDAVSDISGTIHSPIRNGLATYTIVAGQPNVLDGTDHPFQKLLEVRSTQPGGEAVEQFWMLVTGTHTAGNTFTAVTPQLPFLILRDPPGDHSFSFLEKDSTYCIDSHFSTKYGGDAGVSLSVRLGVEEANIPLVPDGGFYVDIHGGVSAGRDNDTGSTLTTCFSTSQIYSTSSEELWNGHKGDVYALMSLTLVYGVSDVLSFDPATCQPVKTRQLSFENVAYNTSVLTNDYQIRQFEIPRTRDLISYFERQGKTDSAQIFRNTLRNWEKVLEKGEQDVAEARPSGIPGQDTLALFAGTDYEQSWRYDTTSNGYYDFNISIDSHLGVEIGTIAELDFAHVIGSAEANFRWEVDTSRSNTKTTSKAFGFHFSDDDAGDRFLVAMKKGPNNDPMIFQTRAGESQCPGEFGTIKREGVQISFDTPVIKGQPGNDTVLAFMQCGNLSGTGEEKTYNLRYLQAGQKGFPGILVDGARLDAATPLPVIIPGGKQKTYRVTVQRYPGEYVYQNVKMVLSSVCDPFQIADTATFAVYFDNGTNAPPQIIRTDAVVGKNVASAIELKAIDPEGDPLQYQILEQPRNGTFTGNTPPNLTYQPKPGFTGTDVFQFNVSDGANVVAKRFTIAVQNTAPVAARTTIDTVMNQDTSVTLHLAASDPDGDPLKDTVIYQPKNGTLNGSPASLVYRPNRGFIGADDFTYGFDDGIITTRVRVNVNVREVYRHPVAATVTAVLSGLEGSTTVNVVKDAFSSNGRPLTVLEHTIPGFGGYAVNNGDGSITFYDTTAAAMNLSSLRQALKLDGGPTSQAITYHITDGIDTTAGTLTVTIDRANTRPVAGFGSALSFDGINDGVALPGISGFSENAITIEYWFKGSNPHSVVRWQPDAYNFIVAGWNGMHILSNDGGTSGISTGNISDGAWHHVAMTWQINTENGFRSYRDGQLVEERNSSPFPIPVATLSQSIVTFGYWIAGNSEFMTGTLDEVRIWNYARSDADIQNGMFQKVPANSPGLVGSWSFDENAGVTVMPEGYNSPFHGSLVNMTSPWQTSGVMLKTSVVEDDTSNLSLRAYDPDGDALTYTIIGQPAHGKLLSVGATSVYIPNKDFTGYDYVTYSVSDGKAVSLTPATLSIYVQNTEDAPVADSWAYETPKNRSVGMRLIGRDPDPGDSLQYIVFQPGHGTLSAVGSYPNEFTYAPGAGFAGVDSFHFRATDGVDTAQATITINVLNQRPQAADTLIAQNAGTAFRIVLYGNDQDAGDNLTYTVLKSPSHGSITTDSLPSLVYHAKSGFGGPDTLRYRVSDGAASDTGQVIFVVMTPTGVSNQKLQLPMAYELYQNYPNPFNPTTRIEYDLPQLSRVSLKVYNILGQEVATLVDGIEHSGKQVALFNANRFASGVYFYRLVAEGLSGGGEKAAKSFAKVRKMVMLK